MEFAVDSKIRSHIKEDKSEKQSLGTSRTSSALTSSYRTYLVENLGI